MGNKLNKNKTSKYLKNKVVRKHQAGNFYGAPTSGMSGLGGAQQSQMQLQQLQQLAMEEQAKRQQQEEQDKIAENKDFTKTFTSEAATLGKGIKTAKAAYDGQKALGYLNNANIIGSAASLAGTGIKKLSDDDNDSKINFGEGFG